MVKFANRMNNVHKSFIREILKVACRPDIISFAGGLPNPELFPVEEIRQSANKVLTENGREALQYSSTEGYLQLRQQICARYRKRFDLSISPEEILITVGSQQALDLLGKIFLNPGDAVLIEKPSYLGAMQAFSLFEPELIHVEMTETGINIDSLKKAIQKHHPRIFYGIPNFQNPTGITYDLENRKTVAKILQDNDILFIEDDPYGELRFIGRNLPSMKNFMGDQAILLGTFSKTVAPGFRLGWVVANPQIMDKLITVKQGADLHASYFDQNVLSRYLKDYDLDQYIAKIKDVYCSQCQAMLSAIEEYFPADVTYTRPEGGMFLWAIMPERINAMDLFKHALEKKVAFVPGSPFFVSGGNNTMRLNYSVNGPQKIRKGIQLLSEAIKKY